MLDAAGNCWADDRRAIGVRRAPSRSTRDNNLVVRALNARVAELRSSSKSWAVNNVTARTAGQLRQPTFRNGMPFPYSNLPLLGAKYADYYRRAKIQETVFEMLTEQYELAKVEEAKETPSVKVLDPGRIRRRNRILRELRDTGGHAFSFRLCSGLGIGIGQLEEVDPKDPRKVFAQEVACAVKAHVSGAWQKGNGAGSKGTKGLGNRLGRRPPTDPVDGSVRGL